VSGGHWRGRQSQIGKAHVCSCGQRRRRQRRLGGGRVPLGENAWPPLAWLLATAVFLTSLPFSIKSCCIRETALVFLQRRVAKNLPFSFFVFFFANLFVLYLLSTEERERERGGEGWGGGAEQLLIHTSTRRERGFLSQPCSSLPLSLSLSLPSSLKKKMEKEGQKVEEGGGWRLKKKVLHLNLRGSFISLPSSFLSFLFWQTWINNIVGFYLSFAVSFSLFSLSRKRDPQRERET